MVNFGSKLMVVLATTAMAMVSFNAHVHGCAVVADIVYLIDTFTDVAKMDFDFANELAAKVSSGFTLDPKATRYAVVLYMPDPSTFFSDSTSCGGLRRAVGAVSDLEGNINFPLLWDQIITSADDHNISKIAIFITSGGSSSEVDHVYVEDANKMKRYGFTVIAIGVGNVPISELGQYASSDKYIYRRPLFKNVDEVADDILQLLCNASRIHDDEIEGPDEADNGNCINDCSDQATGNYAACFPKCQEGVYIACVHGVMNIMKCAGAWYSDDHGNNFVAPMVFNPETKLCQQSLPSCPRNPADYKS